MKGDFSRRTFNRAKHYSSVRMQQGRVQLDADWNEQMDIFDYRQQTELKDFLGTSGAPEDSAGFSIFLDEGNLKIGQGRYYVDGILCENEDITDYTTQPDYPNAELPEETGAYLVYLDVWRHHITGIEDPSIMEVALGGADTCTRLQNVAQVKLLRVTVQTGDPTTEDFPEWLDLINESTARMTPVLDPAHNLRNQLYRVEIHAGGVPGQDQVKFKWSRDNGSIALTISSMTTGTIYVNDANPSQLNLLKEDQWIEVNTVEQELRGISGYFAQITGIIGNEIKVAWDGGVPPTFPVSHKPFIRRWEDKPLPVSAAQESLENGLRISFDVEGEYKVGDYWLIQARAVTNTIEWPLDSNEQFFIEQKPHGIEHHYTKLALIAVIAGEVDVGTGVTDLRKQFPSLQTMMTPDARILGPVDTLADLKLIDTIPHINGVLVQCRATGLYRLDRSATTSASEPDIVVPNNNIGRFFRIAPLTGYIPIIELSQSTLLDLVIEPKHNGCLIVVNTNAGGVIHVGDTPLPEGFKCWFICSGSDIGIQSNSSILYGTKRVDKQTLLTIYSLGSYRYYLEGGNSGKLIAAVPTVSALIAMKVGGLSTGTLVYCAEAGLYSLSQDDPSEPDGFNIVKPDDLGAINVRWRRLTDNKHYLGVSTFEVSKSLNARDNSTLLKYTGSSDATLTLPAQPAVDGSVLSPGFYCRLYNDTANRLLTLQTDHPPVGIKGSNTLYAGEQAVVIRDQNHWIVLKSIQVTGRTEWSLGMELFYPALTNGAVIKQASSNGCNVRGFAFAPATPSAAKAIHGFIKFPKGISKNSFTIKLHWYADKSSTTVPDPEPPKMMVWSVNALWHNNGEDLGHQPFRIENETSIPVFSFYHNTINSTDESQAFSGLGNSNSGLLEIRISREDGGLVFTADAILIGATLYVDKIAGNDA